MSKLTSVSNALPLAEQEPPYPCLKEHKGTNNIWLFTTPKYAVKVGAAVGKIGTVITSACESSYKPYIGSVTLTQE